MIYRNYEHYADPTAGKAIENVMRECRGLSDRPLRPLRDEEFFGTGFSDPSLRMADEIDKANWEDLANAIIVQQAEDYRRCRRILRGRPGMKRTSIFLLGEAEERLREIEAFFQSFWFCQLTTVDGEMILERLRKEEDENDGKGISAASVSA
jgi:hypothetical protein